VHDHDGTAVAHEEALEDLRKLGVPEWNNREPPLDAKRRRLALVGAEDFDALAEDLDD
jgi:hypothetical protein